MQRGRGFDRMRHNQIADELSAMYDRLLLLRKELMVAYPSEPDVSLLARKAARSVNALRGEIGFLWDRPDDMP